MSSEIINFLTVVLVVGLALAGFFLATCVLRRPRLTHWGWERLLNKVERIIADMESSDFPKPTHQMCQLLVVGEDHRFHRHLGVDPIALCRAIWKTFFCGWRQGGSTIAMQLVRTLTNRYEWTCKRKLNEIILALRLTRRVGRDRIPAIYLWVAYYGWQMNNFNQACARTGIDPLSATELESAMLVARLKYPEPRKSSREQTRKIQCRAVHLMSLTHSREKNQLWNRFAFRTRSKTSAVHTLRQTLS